MKETGIIMSGNHPKLILDGLKTMIRRVIVPQPEPCDHQKVWGDKDPQGQKPTVFYEMRSGHWACVVCGKGIKQDPKSDNPFDYIGIKCPYGQVGDRLWVRETWAVDRVWNDSSISRINQYSLVTYATDAKDNRVGKNRPSIFMPRWASRITLEITEVRVERVQEITEEDAEAEGEAEGESWSSQGSGENPEIISAVENYATLWDSLNAKRGYGWEANPWVWVISFKKC